MKFTWEESDITPGTVVGAPMREERWIIGYLAWADGEDKYTLISLSDGMVVQAMTKKKLAAQLSDTNEHPAALLKVLP